MVSIVVPVRNGEAVIGPCIRSLLGARYPNARSEILVVDNASTDRTAEIIQQFPVRYLFAAERGPSCARNRGIEECKGDWVVFVDADCVATTEWLAELVLPFENSDVWGVAGEIISYPPKTKAQRYMAMRKSLWQKPAVESRFWPFAVTANVAFRRETFAHIGLFDPLLVRGQDKDFGRRFLDAGLELAYAPRAVVFHRHRETTWGFFRQHMGWGFGAALLHVKYRLPWGFRHEASKYAELLASLGALGRSAIRYRLKGGDEMDLYYPYHEVVRRLGQRAGLIQGLGWRIRRGWNPGWPDVPYPEAPGGDEPDSSRSAAEAETGREQSA